MKEFRRGRHPLTFQILLYEGETDKARLMLKNYEERGISDERKDKVERSYLKIVLMYKLLGQSLVLRV